MKRGIKKHQMFTFRDQVLVAVSGGKDSLVLWKVLRDLGYEAHGLYLHLGIGDYSSHSQEMCEKFASEEKLPLHSLDITRLTGMGIKELAQRSRRPPCGTCGLLKRYLFNRFAQEYQFPVMATGHNLDDEAATLLGNLLHWQTGYLARQSPVMPSNHPSMVKKVKPLYRLTEKETGSYAVIRGIDYLLEECPMATGASSINYKNALNFLENQSPGTKQQLYYGFLREGKKHFASGEDSETQVDSRSCEKCGQPTTIEVCAFCHLLEKVGIEKIDISTSYTCSYPAVTKS